MEATHQADAADILTDIEAFRERVGLPETTFGRRAIGDANLIAGLRAGRELRRSTEHRVRTFMVTYVPTSSEQAAA